MTHHQSEKATIQGLRWRKRLPARPESALVTIESQMHRKGRVQSSYASLRNGIRENYPGDKAYKVPECSGNFFKEPSLIVGSTNWQKKRTLRRFEDVVFANEKKDTDWSKRPRRVWSAVVQAEARQKERDEVDGIEAWEGKILKEFRPDWRDPDDDEWFFKEIIDQNELAKKVDLKKVAPKGKAQPAKKK